MGDKLTCSDCRYLIKNELQIYKCLQENKVGTKETHPVFPACELFGRKINNDIPFFKSEAINRR